MVRDTIFAWIDAAYAQLGAKPISPLTKQNNAIMKLIQEE